MNKKIRAILYVLLIVTAIAFGHLFYEGYSAVAAWNAQTRITLPDESPVAVETDAPGSGWVAHGAMFVLAVIGFALLFAHDLTQLFAHKTGDFLFNDDAKGMQKDPEYEDAEQVWANGDHLEAIRLMREYLASHPREQFVALRIAEIYEKDLQNPLAAALEYEEVLKKKLPAERWGWAAIHLCNLYLKLGKEVEAVALLRRIDAEYGRTSAADKARKRLADMAETGQLAAIDEGLLSPPGAQPAPASSPSAAPSAPGHDMPPGFSPKKR